MPDNQDLNDGSHAGDTPPGGATESDKSRTKGKLKFFGAEFDFDTTEKEVGKGFVIVAGLATVGVVGVALVWTWLHPPSGREALKKAPALGLASAKLLLGVPG